MTINVIPQSNYPEAEIAISSDYDGTVWLSYAEQVQLVSWLLHNRKSIVKMIQNRRIKSCQEHENH